jgi:hypothetical protein
MLGVEEIEVHWQIALLPNAVTVCESTTEIPRFDTGNSIIT